MPMPPAVLLREVTEKDFQKFFEFESDSESARLAAFAGREKDAFFAHWAKLLVDDTVSKWTIVLGDAVAGNIVAFERSGKREVGYWLGREFWGRGIGTRALAEFLQRENPRPLHAHVARHNAGSIRILEKCGFRICGEDPAFSSLDGQVVTGVILVLDRDSVTG